MILAVPRESVAGEARVALVPEVVARLKAKGFDVRVEAGAGAAASIPDQAFADAGAMVVGDAADLLRDADLVVAVQAPAPERLSGLRRGTALIALLQPLTSPETIRALADAGVSALAMELVPRITRAQKMDVLSSQATAAGYHAVLLAAAALPRFFPMLMTAAGTVPPARVLVLGAGVAGLQAIATARRLGAVVQGFDIRPAVKEQVESLGATFVGLTVEEAESEGGYAKEVSEDVHRREQELLHKLCSEADVVISTAQIPGKKPPVLITRASVEAMRPGSVIVDLAAESGGNCELSRAGETVVHDGVRIMAPRNAAAAVALHASQMYARNVLELLMHLVSKNGSLALDPTDEITGAVLVTHGGEVVNDRVKATLTPGAA